MKLNIILTTFSLLLITIVGGLFSFTVYQGKQTLKAQETIIQDLENKSAIINETIKEQSKTIERLSNGTKAEALRINENIVDLSDNSEWIQNKIKELMIEDESINVRIKDINQRLLIRAGVLNTARQIPPPSLNENTEALSETIKTNIEENILTENENKGLNSKTKTQGLTIKIDTAEKTEIPLENGQNQPIIMVTFEAHNTSTGNLVEFTNFQNEIQCKDMNQKNCLLEEASINLFTSATSAFKNTYESKLSTGTTKLVPDEKINLIAAFKIPQENSTFYSVTLDPNIYSQALIIPLGDL